MMGKTESDAGAQSSIDHELAAVLPKDNRPWWKQHHLLKLNLSIGSILMFCTPEYPDFLCGPTKSLL